MAKRKDNQPAAAGRRLDHNRGKSKAELRDERRHRSARKQRIKRGIIYAGTSTLALLLVLGIVLPQTLGGGSSLTVRTEDERNSAVGEIPLPSGLLELNPHINTDTASAQPQLDQSILADPNAAGLSSTVVMVVVRRDSAESGNGSMRNGQVVNPFDPSQPSHLQAVNHPIGTFNYEETPATSQYYYQAATVILPGGNEVSAPPRGGTYDFDLPDEVLVSNLRVGGVGLHYDCIDLTESECNSLVEQLEDLDTPQLTVISPYTGLKATTGATIAVTAWETRLYLDRVIPDTIEAFINEYPTRSPLGY